MDNKKSLISAAKNIKLLSTVVITITSILLAIAVALVLPALIFDNAVTIPSDNALHRLLEFFMSEEVVTFTDICVAYLPKAISALIGVVSFALLRKYATEVGENERWFYNDSFQRLLQVTISFGLAFFVPLVLSRVIMHILPNAFDVKLYFNFMALIVFIIMAYMTVKAKKYQQKNYEDEV